MSKRFYTTAGTVEVKGGYGIVLDDKAVKTPAGADLVLPTVALAEAIAAEWGAQGDEIAPATMPMMQLASTAIDRVAAVRHEVIAAVAGYGETDLLCHRDAAGTDLAKWQAEQWQPHLDWLARDMDVLLKTGEGIMPVVQDKAALDALRGHIAACGDDMVLAGVSELTALLGSVVLALAVFHERLDAADAHEQAHLEEAFQEERWGRDDEALEARTRRKAEVVNAARFLKLLRP